MRSRVPSARPRGIGFVEGVRLAFDKRGADGSGKANLVPATGGVVWGVLWTFPGCEWAALDGFEPGYQRRTLEVTCQGEPLRAEAYVATRLTEDPLPLAGYKQRILDGAREHALPQAYVAQLESLACKRG